MRLGEVALIRTPETEQRFGGRVVFATLVHRTAEYLGFDIHGGLSIMARFARTARYAPTCLLCSAEEIEEPELADLFYSVAVSTSESTLSPMHRTLHDAMGGGGFGQLCEACKELVQNTCEELGVKEPKIWMPDRSR